VPDTLKRTSLFETHRTLGARLVPFAGWEMPVQYTGVAAEHRAVRTAAGLFDVSHMGELSVTGEGAVAAVNALVTNDLARIADGQAMYTCCCREDGGILDDLIVYRTDAASVLVVCNASNHDQIAAHFAAHLASGPVLEDASARTALLALQGPRALEILAIAGCSLDVSRDLPPFRHASVSVGGIACRVARTGYTGEDGVELFCDWDAAPALWKALFAAGAPLGLAAVGLGARDTLRLEARLALYGNDIDETTHPFEAGLGWTVKLDGPDFLGKAALTEIRARGLSRRLVGFEMTGRGIARHGYPLLDREGRAVGTCTSGSPSPTLEKNIGLGYLPVPMAEPGTEFLVDCRGRHIGARVVPTPFYRRARHG
jgi:aminomethyltransferase